MPNSRRRTLDVLPPQLPFLTPSEPMPRAARRHARVLTPPMSIDVGLADGGKKIRPLPRIPHTPKSAPAAPSRHRSNPSVSSTSSASSASSSLARPLPCLPESGDFSFAITLATPLPPLTPYVARDQTRLAPPARSGPPRMSSLSIETSPDALDHGAFDETGSPLTPYVPEPPSPRTAHRLRNSKLRRHLGESVAVVLDTPEAVDVLHRMRQEEKDAHHAYLLGNVLDLRPEPDFEYDCEYSDSDDEDDDDYESEHDRFYPQIPPPPQAPPPLPPTQKWVRERGDQRWTEDNFSQLLRDLRSL
ncbi:hypothetical protein MKEN_00084300 [Mycena kentingensis (nom. inval.)]|nr:hypothetical protein MKEN_00084300 [Mycena kentingensis (nom. inval.)]